ncbi:MAG: hypothetical protein EHM43_11865, partial [Ignavibacteriae bacterium]
MRPFDVLAAEIDVAIRANDADALTAIAKELSTSAELEAEALEHRAMAGVERLNARFTIAIEHYQRAMELHRAVYDRANEAKDAAQLGAVYSIMGDFPGALEHFHHALAIVEELNDAAGIAQQAFNIGQAHNSTGDYPSALEFYLRSLRQFENLGDRAGMARVTGAIGTAHANGGNRVDALAQYEIALQMHEEAGNRLGVAQVIGNLGTLHVETNDLSAALDDYRRAMAIHEELGNDMGAAGMMINICFVLLDTNRLDEARELIARFESLNINDPRIRIIQYNLTAHLREHEGNLEEANSFFETALEEAMKFGLRNEASDLHKAMRDLSEKRDDFKAYIRHNNAYAQLSDEIKGKEAALKMVMQQKQREIESIEKERARERTVLYSTLPKHVADRMVRGERVTDHFDAVSVMFLDIVGFTRLSDKIQAEHVVDLLEAIFQVCDAVCAANGLTKIKTIGDSYLPVSGIPEPTADHADRMATAAVQLLQALNVLEVKMDPSKGSLEVFKEIGDITVRIGLHCGPLVAGVIGNERLQYDIWGDTVNMASRMESTSEPGRIQVSEQFAQALGNRELGTGN